MYFNRLFKMQTDGGQNSCETQQVDEEITLELPTELVPDEYKHENGSNGQVYIFYDNKGAPLAKKLEHSLKVHEFDISSENVFIINHVDDILKEEDKVAGSDFTEKSCLLLIIIGAKNIFTRLQDSYVSLKIWSPFINNHTLKYKPKIFMFFEYEEEAKMRTDSFGLPMQQPYDVPSEADVLIVYQKSIGINLNEHGFIDTFSKNVETFGKRDDIVGLLTRTEHKFRPVIISTLRKKFYLTPSRYRDHYFDVLSNGENILKELETLIISLNQPKIERQQKTGSRILSDSITNKLQKKLQQNQVIDKSPKKNQLVNKDGPAKKKTLVTDGSAKKKHLVTDGPSNKNHVESDGSNNLSSSIYNNSKKEKPQVWRP